MTDPQFVEKAVQAQKTSYTDLVNNTPSGSIPVVDNKTGNIGYIPINEFSPANYTKL